jgi:hypothetical protein
VLPLLTGCRFTTLTDSSTGVDVLASRAKPLDPTVRLCVSSATCRYEKRNMYTVKTSDITRSLIHELRALGYQNVGGVSLSDPDYSIDLAIDIVAAEFSNADDEVVKEGIWNMVSIVCLVGLIPPWPTYWTGYGTVELDVWGTTGALERVVSTKVDTVCLSVWPGLLLADHRTQRHVRAAAYMLADALNAQQRQKPAAARARQAPRSTGPVSPRAPSAY